MALSLQFFFGRLMNKGELVTNAKVNAVVKGISAQLSGTVGNADLGAASVDPTKVQQGPYFYATATLAAGTYTGTWTPSVTSYVDGLILTFKASAANSGAVNLDAGSGAKPIRKWNGKALESGDIGTGQMVSVRYNSTLVGGGCWEVVGVPGQPTPENYRYAAGTASGASPTVYTITLADAPAAYVAGLAVTFQASANNTGNVQLNVNGLGVKALVHPDVAATALVSNEIVTNQVLTAVYDGTNFQAVTKLQTVYTPAEAVVATGRNIVAKSLSVSQVNVTADELIVKRASDGRTVLLSTVNVTADITLGVALNGLDAGVEAGNTFYYVWVICDGTNVASLLSVNSTNPTLPGSYLYKALVSVVRNDAGANFVSFWQSGRQLNTNDDGTGQNPIFTGQAGVLAYASQSLSPYVPLIAKRVQGRLGSSSTAGAARQMAIAGDANGMGAQGVAGQESAATLDGFSLCCAYDVPMPTAQTVYWKAGSTAAVYRLSVSGYEI